MDDSTLHCTCSGDVTAMIIINQDRAAVLCDLYIHTDGSSIRYFHCLLLEHATLTGFQADRFVGRNVFLFCNDIHIKVGSMASTKSRNFFHE